jgi:hypothetical protein
VELVSTTSFVLATENTLPDGIVRALDVPIVSPPVAVVKLVIPRVPVTVAFDVVTVPLHPRLPDTCAPPFKDARPATVRGPDTFVEFSLEVELKSVGLKI